MTCIGDTIVNPCHHCRSITSSSRDTPKSEIPSTPTKPHSNLQVYSPAYSGQFPQQIKKRRKSSPTNPLFLRWADFAANAKVTHSFPRHLCNPRNPPIPALPFLLILTRFKPANLPSSSPGRFSLSYHAPHIHTNSTTATPIEKAKSWKISIPSESPNISLKHPTSPGKA